LGTPTVKTNSSGTTVWQGEFKPFGEPLSVTGSITNNLRFPGQYFDSETGLNQNWHRDYNNAEVGRYVEFDPILKPNFLITDEMFFFVPYLVRTSKLFYPYSYVGNNPILRDDTKGLGLVAFFKCLYYGSKVSKFGDQCNGECPSNLEGTSNFIEKHTTSGSLEIAMLSCTCKKAGPELCAKWLASCFSTPIGMGPKPR
jgi:RHS repeat-associated protein